MPRSRKVKSHCLRTACLPCTTFLPRAPKRAGAKCRPLSFSGFLLLPPIPPTLATSGGQPLVTSYPCSSLPPGHSYRVHSPLSHKFFRTPPVFLCLGVNHSHTQSSRARVIYIATHARSGNLFLPLLSASWRLPITSLNKHHHCQPSCRRNHSFTTNHWLELREASSDFSPRRPSSTGLGLDNLCRGRISFRPVMFAARHFFNPFPSDYIPR